jgi:hypothetical protein
MALRFSPQLDVCCGSIAQNNSLAFFGLKDPERKKIKKQNSDYYYIFLTLLLLFFLIF